MGASGVCAPDARLDPWEVDPGHLDGDGSSNVRGMIDWLKVRTEAKTQLCDKSLAKIPDRLLPPTWTNTTYHTCRDDNSLCCYQIRGSGCDSDFGAFLFIESTKYLYRVHYAISHFTMEIVSLEKIYQFCSSPGECENEPIEDDLPGVPCNETHNPLEELEKYIYADDDDDTSNQTVSVGPEHTTSFQTSVKARHQARNKQQASRKPSLAQLN